MSPRADTRVADVTYPASDNAMPSKMSCSLTVSWSMPAPLAQEREEDDEDDWDEEDDW